MKIKFVKQNFWIGLYWKTEPPNIICTGFMQLDEVVDRTFYLCLIPCFPIIWKTRIRKTLVL